MPNESIPPFPRPASVRRARIPNACARSWLLAAALACVGTARAGVDFSDRLADPANLAGTGAFGLYPVDFLGNGQRTLVSIGDLQAGGDFDQTEVVTLGAPIGGVLQRSAPWAPRFTTVERAVATSNYPHPLVLVGGYGANPGFDVYGGTPLVRVFSRPVPGINSFVAAAFTRVAGDTDFDVALGTVNQIALWPSNATAPTWSVSTSSLSALALLPAYGANPARLICAGSQVELRDLSDGHVVWSTPISGGRKILVGNTAGDASPEFVIVGAGSGLAAFSSNPPNVAWQSTGSYVDADLYDRNGDGLLDVVYTDYDQHLGWLNGATGAPLGAAVSVPQRIDHVAVANVGGTGPSLIARTPPGRGAGLGIWPLTLAAEQAHEQVETGPFDRFVIGDVDGSGHDKIAGLSYVSLDYNLWPTRLRIVDPQTGSLQWSSSFPTNVAPEDSGKFIDLDLTRLTPGGHPVIALLGAADLAGLGATIVYLDGVTHAVLKQQGFSLPEKRVATQLRMIDVNGDGVPEVVLVSQPSDSVTAGLMVHVLRSDTLAVTWSSPILADAFPASWVEVRPAVGGDGPRLLIGIPFYGLWSVNLGTHLVDYTVPGKFNTAAYLPATSAADRLAAFDTATGSVRLFDAASGAELDTVPFTRTYRALAGDPNDADRLLMVTDNHVAALRLSDHAHEAVSRELGGGLGAAGVLRTRTVGGTTVAYVGDGVGLRALTLNSPADTLFMDGFESW